VVLQKCKSEIKVDVEVVGVKVDMTGITEVVGVTVTLADDSGSEVRTDGLDAEMDGVSLEDPSMSIGSRGSNSLPSEIRSSSSSGLSAAFSAEVIAVADAGRVGVMVGLAGAAGGGFSISGGGTIIGAAGCLGVRWCRVSCLSSNSSYLPLCA
jgi:hypothetical protein